MIWQILLLLVAVAFFLGLDALGRANRRAQQRQFPDDVNELRRAIFSTAERLGELKRELKRRQIASQAKNNAEFQAALDRLLRGEKP